MSEQPSFSASVQDWKLVYRVLHGSLSNHLELMDCTFLDKLQAELQNQARGEGVDVGDHGQWDRWLGNTSAPSCEDRVSRRRTLE